MSKEGSRHGSSKDSSQHGPFDMRRVRSTGVLRQDTFERHFKPDTIMDAVYNDDQRTIDAILARGGTHEVRAAIVWRVSQETLRKLYARGCHDQDFLHNLFSAARFDHPQTLEALLDHTGLTVHTMEHIGRYRNSLLYAAAQAGWTHIVARLLQRGADPRVGRYIPGIFGRHTHHTSCLETAIRNGQAGAARVILADGRVSSHEKHTMLNMALRESDNDCIRALLMHGAKPDRAQQQAIIDLADPLLRLLLRQTLAKLS